MGASLKWRFAATFLVVFGILVAVWWRFDVAVHYRAAALATAQVVSPIVNGWWLEYDRPGMVDPVVFRSGPRQLPMLLQLPALSMGLMPFLSLVMATPGLRWRRRLVAAGGGAILFFLVHVGVVLTYPFIMDRPNLIKDTLGVFTGLLAFVVAPLGLWFGLTYSALRPLWHLSGAGSET